MGRALLAGFVAIFGAVCAIIAGAHIVLGPAAIPGSIRVNATMDSEDRFYATLFLGFGLANIWASRRLSERRRVLELLMLVFFAGGVARLVSIAAVGPPNALFLFLGSLELVIPIGVWLALRQVSAPA